MEPIPPNRRERNRLAQTVNVAGGGGPSSIDSNSVACPRVELIEGSDSGLSGETRSLLRTRLRAAALVLCLGSLAFYIKGLFEQRAHQPDESLHRAEDFLWWFQVVHITVLGLVSYKLCWKCNLSLRWLRIAETIVFGLTTLFFVAVQHCVTVISVTKLGYVFNPVGMWFTLMFTYAIYIPTTWRRAAIVLGFMSLAPIACLAADRMWYQQAGDLLSFDQISGVVLMLVIGFCSSVYGTYMVGTLRREAFAAKQLGQYRLRHLLGAGGMGEVYLAEHQLLKRPCAIKLIRPNKARDPQALARFEREVRATATLSHWNTVEIFDYGSTDDGTFYYVMEYLPGLSLAELVERHGPLPPERVIYLLEQTCDALREAHAMGLVHRDIKPGNIFAATRGGVYDVAKLLDFGLAKCVDKSVGTQLTQEGMITGSPLYMSPEQALGDAEPDARSDIYSLGAVAYYLLVGRPPFDSDQPVRVLVAHAHDDVVPPSRHRSDVPADLERVVMRCLAKDPTQRYDSAAELSRDLSACDAAGVWTRDQAANWWSQIGEREPVAVA